MKAKNVTREMQNYFDLHHVIAGKTANDISITTDIALRMFFGRARNGQSEIFTAPFAKGVSTRKLLQEWNDVLKSISSEWPSLYEFEMDLAAKVGPLSIAKPIAERIPDIVDYYTGILLPSRPLAPWATWDVIHEWQSLKKSVRVQSEEVTVNNMKKSTNSGAPFFDKRRKVIEDTGFNISISAGSNIVTKLRDYTNMNTAVIGWRGQEGGIKMDDVKQRVVWMFPFAINILELSVYQPIIKAAQAKNLVSPWVSNEEVDVKITKLFDTKRDGDLIVCTDFTKFDQHFNQHLVESAEETIEFLLTDGKPKDSWLRSVFPVKYYIPMMYDYGRVFTGPHGMASGSGGTNVDETLAHRALQYEVAGLNDATLNPNSMCLGDDGVLSYPGITPKDVMEAYSSHGLEMNLEKQYKSFNDCIFLRRWHHQDYRVQEMCVGVYSTMRALGRLRYLERWMKPDVWDRKSVALRQLSILENCKYHPLKEQFVEFCMKRDKYRLGLDIPEFLDNIVEIAQEYIDLMPGFLGYTKTLQFHNESEAALGIADWWIVKYLKSM